MDSDPNVEAILVNIFAVIARCDVNALGLIKGLSTLGMKKPIVLLLKGTMVDEVHLPIYISQKTY
jgi:succinyl-CoA synthetase beta subunit